MTAKAYLSQLYEAERTKRRLQDRIDELTVKAGYGTGRVYARNFSGCDERRCPMEIAILDQWEKTDELEEFLAAVDELAGEIKAAINAVPDDGHLRTVLTMRYVEFLPFEDMRAGLGYKHIQRVFEAHGDALGWVRVPKGGKTLSGIKAQYIAQGLDSGYHMWYLWQWQEVSRASGPSCVILLSLREAPFAQAVLLAYCETKRRTGVFLFPKIDTEVMIECGGLGKH